MKLLILSILALNSCIALATSIDLECQFYPLGNRGGANPEQMMEFRHEVKLSAFSMKPVESPRNSRDIKLLDMDENIIADFKESQFRIADLKKYDRDRHRFFLEVYKKDSQGNLEIISLMRLEYPPFIDGRFMDRTVDTYYFPSTVQVQCTFTDEWI